jgi:predicted RNA binding protein YcfA (HicA-like mRNA interferase family)
MPKLPSVSGERVVRALKRAGFVELPQKGSHVSLERKSGNDLFKTVSQCTPNSQKAPFPTSSSSAA